MFFIMKQLILVLTLTVSVFGFSQNNQTTAMVSHKAEFGHMYEFEHEITYFPELEQRLFNYANRNGQVILELNIEGGKCVVLLKNDISPDLLNETLLFLAQGLSYSDFYIDTDN
jgi:hypothetical protein